MQGDRRDTSDETLSELYSELSQEQPSTALDEKILAEAHKAVAPKRAAGPFSASWAVPASMAAVIVLSVIVVTTIERKAPDATASFPGPAMTEIGSVPDGQATGSERVEETAPFAELEHQAAEPVIDSDTVENQTRTADELASAEVPSPGKSVSKREKKKAPVALAKSAPLSRTTDEPAAVAEQEATLQAMAKAPQGRLSTESREEDKALADSLQRKQTIASADHASSPTELAASEIQSGELTQNAQPNLARQAVRPSPVYAQPRASLSQSLKDDLDKSCANLSELDCLKSPICILQKNQRDSTYQCRAADNSCESGFMQSLHQKSDCEAKQGCKFLPANCYCEPEKLCACAGGTPAMCMPGQQDGSR
ncbi:hypothetical protein [Kaarinaea lacus]